ncbi:MAG: hypothetical protein NVS2B3_14400 [Vulcanimicrobiaceae bacterium]
MRVAPLDAPLLLCVSSVPAPGTYTHMNRWRTVSLTGAVVATGGVLLGRATRLRGVRNAGAAVPYGHGTRIEHHATIAREPADVYAAWRTFEHLPLVMPNVRSVEVLDEKRSRWTVAGPFGREVSWEATIIDDTPGERIAWRADAAPVPHAGSIRFTPAPGERGTEVSVEIEYMVPGAKLGGLFVKATTKIPPVRLGELDLRRFKSMLEANDVALNGTDVIA